MEQSNPRRVLFVGEWLTPSHVMRPLILANAFKRRHPDCDVHVAVAAVPEWFSLDANIVVHNIYSPAQTVLAERVRKVIFPLYTACEIDKMVREEISLLRTVSPEIIVHDFRNTLAISSQVVGVKLISVNDFYWNTHFQNREIYPDTPLSRFVGYARARSLAKIVAPYIESWHVHQFNVVAKRYKLAPFSDLRDLYNTGAEQWLFDIPEVLPPFKDKRVKFIGPMLWENQVAEPAWLVSIADKSAVCVTFTSSGNQAQVEAVLKELAALQLPVIVLTAGKYTLAERQGVYVATYAPITAVLQKCRLLVSTGASSIVYHALKMNVPVVGIPQNITQWYSMSRFVELGFGVLIPPEQARGSFLRHTLASVLEDATYEANTEKYRQSLRIYNPESLLSENLLNLT